MNKFVYIIFWEFVRKVMDELGNYFKFVFLDGGKV